MNKAIVISILTTCTLYAYAGNVQIKTNHTQRCISSNGLPDHSTGSFPNHGNPHSISEQNIHYCFPLTPIKNNQPKPQHGSIGVALNGITIRPGTADYWDASSPRGHSRDRSSGWNLEGLGSRNALGMDQNNAHVDNRGLYHYHGVAPALIQSTIGSLIAYAADGFEIHYLSQQRSSYQLKRGTRPSGPGGSYDGSYNEDWEYIAGSGTLDECNGGMLNGKFVYFATDTYPFFPRCLWGNASSDFGQESRRGQDEKHGSHRQVHSYQEHSHPKHTHSTSNKQPDRPFNKGGGRKPPQEAITACSGKSSGNSCNFSSRGRTITGSCRNVPSGEIACVPAKRH